MAVVRTIVVDRVLRAPPSYIFDSLADPARLEALSRLVRRVDLLREGSPAPYGAGAVRLVDVWPVLLEEEVTGFDHPRRFEYLIRRARPPFDHKGGSLVLEPTPDGGTHVTWTTKFGVDVPLVSRAGAGVTAAVVRASLAGVLIRIDRRWRAAA